MLNLYRVFVVIFAFVAMSTSSGDGQLLPTQPQFKKQSQQLRDYEIAKQFALKQVAPLFESSLNTKESVDFILTPALIVQELIADKFMITYPGE